MKKYDCIIWDFNGTILNDVMIGIESINVLLKRRGLEILENVEEYKKSFGFPIIKWYEKLGFDFEKEPYDDVANEWLTEYLRREPTAGLCDGVEDLLKYFRRCGLRQVIISASEINMLKKQLASLNIAEYFDDVIGKSDIYASGKSEIAEQWKRKNSGEMLFIGDTDHDLEAAERMGVDCVLVACGHQSYEKLSALKPVADIELTVVRKMDDILSL